MSEKISQEKRIGGISAAKETGKMRRGRGKTLLISAIAAVLITAAALSPILLSGCSNRKNNSDSPTSEVGSNPDSPLMTSDNSAGLSERTSSVSQTAETGGDPSSPLQTSDSSAGLSGETDSGKEDMSSTIAAAVEEAKLYAASYDYDKATARLEPLKEKDGSGEVGRLLAELSSLKGTLEEADITAIPHIFFHSLIVDPSLAFHNNKARADDYNTAMTTVDEFNRIIQQMYDRDYVLVSLHQMAQYTEEADGSGAMKAGKIMLPPGKKPIVLSIDDMSYYAYMMEDGFATKLVIGSDGSLTNEMVKNDGTVVYGSFDVVPLLDDFIKMHPDFSYQGAKGVIALTGYDGVFGYRTDQDYYLKEHLLYEQAEWLKKHPDFDYEKDIADAKAVAQALRDDGWELASHSWGHRDMKENPMEKFVVDMEKWINRVESLIGETDILIYPFGTDVESGAEYTMANEKYAWLHDHGFHYFCTVNSEQPYVQLGDQYLRQGRINADGYMMYHFPEKLTPYFDVDSVFDSVRPTPVPKY